MYMAGGNLTGMQNGLAISGDFLSATTLLGITGLFFASGLDAAIYYYSPLVGLCLLLVLIAAPLRRLGQYTLGDVMVEQLSDPRLRLFSGGSAVVISLTYLIAQMVGAGSLISIMFGLSFNVAVISVGTLVSVYVAFGGMLAATWVQIVKAVLLIAAVVGLSALVLLQSGGFPTLYARVADVHPLGEAVFHSGGSDLGLFSTLSLAAGLILGMMGLPHILIRLFTVPDEAAAKQSIVVASSIIGCVFLLLFAVVGPGTIAFVMGDPLYSAPGPDGLMSVRGGGNMAVLHLAAVLGGSSLFGIVSGVAFATILAVVAGLTIAAASATSHDIIATLRRGRAMSERVEIRVFRVATVVIALSSVALAILFQRQNVAFLAALAFAIAASTNFPVLLLALYWPRMTAAGALAGGSVGLVSSVALIVGGPAVWVQTFGNERPLFPSDYPTLVTAPLAFLVCVAVSLMTLRYPPAAAASVAKHQL